MMPTSAEFKKLTPWIAIFVVCVLAGGGLIWLAERLLAQERQQLAAAQTERTQNREKLSRISDEEREVREKAEVYSRLKSLGLIGSERRLEWADTMRRVRSSRELLDLRYRVEPRRVLGSIPGKPANVEFYSSLMIIEMSMLHEGDLLRLLSDLRESGNAYYSVSSCSISRLTQAPANAAPSVAPRLSAQCNIELITIIDPGAKA
jgi:hypothetical protein